MSYADQVFINVCREILEGDPGNKMKRCPELVEEVYQKCVELLSEKGGLP